GEHRGPSPPGERDRSVHQVQDVRAGELYFRVCSTDLEGPDPPRELPDRHVAKVRVDHTGVPDGGAFHRVPVDQAVPPPRRELLMSPILRSITTSVEGNLHLGGGVSREG